MGISFALINHHKRTPIGNQLLHFKDFAHLKVVPFSIGGKNVIVDYIEFWEGEGKRHLVPDTGVFCKPGNTPPSGLQRHYYLSSARTRSHIKP